MFDEGVDAEYKPSREGKSFGVHLCKDYLKFTAAHFIAFKGYRERIHGHNYRVGIKVWGGLGDDGYVMDFIVVKTALRGLCKEINEHVILPSRSDVLDIKLLDGNIQVKCEDGSMFSFPKDDCKLLPIVHTSAEELAEYLLWRCVKLFTKDYLFTERKVTAMEISVAEAEGQYATHYVDFTANEAKFTARNPPVARPCPSLARDEANES